MAGVKPEEFQQAGKHERLIRALEIAGNEITDEVFRYWTQNRELEVKLEILQPEEGAQPPLDEGPILQIRVLRPMTSASLVITLRYRSRRLRVTITSRHAKYELLDGEPLPVVHHGKEFQLGSKTVEREIRPVTAGPRPRTAARPRPYSRVGN